MGSNYLLERISQSLIEIGLLLYVQVGLLLAIIVLLWQAKKAIKVTKTLSSPPSTVSLDEQDKGEFKDIESQQAEPEKDQSLGLIIVVIVVVFVIGYIVAQLTGII